MKEIFFERFIPLLLCGTFLKVGIWAGEILQEQLVLNNYTTFAISLLLVIVLSLISKFILEKYNYFERDYWTMSTYIIGIAGSILILFMEYIL